MDIITAFLITTFSLLILGWVIAFSPTLIMIELAILTQSKNPIYLTALFISGLITPVILFVLFAMFTVGQDPHVNIFGNKHAIELSPLLDLLAGVTLIVVGIIMYRGDDVRSLDAVETEKLLSGKKLYWFGAVKMATSVSSLAAIIIAANLLKDYTNEVAFQAAGIVWLVIAVCLPFIVIPVIMMYHPKLFKRLQQYSNRVTRFNWSKVIAIGFITVGVGLAVIGIALYL